MKESLQDECSISNLLTMFQQLLCSSISYCFTLFHHFGYHTALSLLVIQVPPRELSCLNGLLYVISGLLAGGSPGFRIVLCCFTHYFGREICVIFVCSCLPSVSEACFILWAATNSFSASFCELRHSGFSSLCPWQILVVVVFVGPCPVRFLLCFSAGWRSAYLAGGSAFRPLRFGFVVSFVF